MYGFYLDTSVYTDIGAVYAWDRPTQQWVDVGSYDSLKHRINWQ